MPSKKQKKKKKKSKETEQAGGASASRTPRLTLTESDDDEEACGSEPTAVRIGDDDSDDDEEQGGEMQDEDADAIKRNRREKRKLQRQKQLEVEAEIAAEEHSRLTRLQHEEALDPEAVGLAAEDGDLTADDFERMLLSRADDSDVWIRYMAHHIKMSELSKGRAVAERAINTISFRRDNDRLHVWLAYLNMECAFGDDAHFDSLFTRALAHNDQKKIYLHVTHVLESHGRRNDAVDTAEKACAKYATSKKMWIRHLELLFHLPSTAAMTATDTTGFKRYIKPGERPEQVDLDQVQRVVLKALQRLPKQDHLSLLTKVARLEYKFGSLERGKSYFEKIVAEYPKRVDLWQQYLETHTAAHSPPRSGETADKAPVRLLFERVTSLPLKVRNMKTFFSLWLRFEKLHGDPIGAEAVQTKARHFVQQYEGCGDE
eukprot:Selendium_serpulae@DN1267_c0_g1_i1.p1